MSITITHNNHQQNAHNFITQKKFMVEHICRFPFCQAVCRGKQRYCSDFHRLLSTKCWVNTCNNNRFVHQNGKKAPGCCKRHTFYVNDILSNKLNCDGSKPCKTGNCRPYDARDVAHTNLITGDICYCFECICDRL